MLAAMTMCVLAWSGCGLAGRTMSLPNGYECVIDKSFIGIHRPNEPGPYIGDIGQLDIQGNLVIGTRLEARTEREIGYFLLDTATHELELFEFYHELEAEMTLRGIDHPNIRWPGAFFNGVTTGFLIGSLLAALTVVASVLLFARWTLGKHRHAPKYPGY